MSRDVKRQMCWFQIDDAEAIARHLEKMEAKGWRVQAVDNWYWTYQRVVPANVRYAVTFFPDASVYDSAPTEGQETYADYCRAAGWELAAAYGPVQYFRSERTDPPPIETDEAVKLTAIRRTMRKTFVLSYGMLLLLPLIYIPTLRLSFRRPVEFFSDSSTLAMLALMIGIVLFAGSLLLDYLVWLLRSRYAVKRGGSCAKPHTKVRLWINGAMLVLCGVVLVAFFVGTEFRALLVLLMVLYGGLMLLGRVVLRALKKCGYSRGGIRAAFLGFALAAGLVTMLVMTFVLLPLVSVWRDNRAEETYTYTSPDGSFSMTREARHDPLPVTLEYLGYPVVEEDACTYKAEIKRSPVAACGEYVQRALNLDSELPDLDYCVYETGWPWLLDKCWESLLAEKDDSSWPLVELDPAPWGAEQVYQQEGLSSWLFRFSDRVVTVHLIGELAPENLEIIVKILRQ